MFLQPLRFDRGGAGARDARHPQLPARAGIGRRRRRRAFTLVEISIVVFIIGLLTVIAMPAVFKARMRALNTTFANDLRQLTASLEQYAIQEGDYPPDTAEGVMPPGFEAYMPRRIRYEDSTPIGGLWDWDRASNRMAKVFGLCYAGMSVWHPNRTTAQMIEVDEHIDDGDLDNGRFRRRDQGYIYILEP
jgi:prepilin-type N-terminal cleavage/methylation domain-containing protein